MLKTKKGFVKISSKSKKELESLAKSDAFKVGKSFSKAEILPLVSMTAVESDCQNSKQLLHDIKDIEKPSEVLKHLMEH